MIAQDGACERNRPDDGAGGRVQAAIRRKLSAALRPAASISCDSAHAGHAGARPEGESHFTVEIVSARFAGLSRVARQRLVYGALADELRTDIHALALKTLAPDEDAGYSLDDAQPAAISASTWAAALAPSARRS